MERNTKKILNEFFGYENFREGQEEIIDSIISGNEVLAVLPTGGGKSLCFQIPAIMSENRSIVISPMISLMKDQVDGINQNRKIAGFINSSQTYQESENVFKSIEKGEIKILYLSPEKINSQQFQKRLKSFVWDFLFVDEAHCISEWGHNFRPSYRFIRDFANSIGISKISAFTATATPQVRKDIVEQLKMESFKIFVFGFERPNLALNVIETSKKKEILLKIVNQFASPTIVYCATRKETEEVSFFLNSNNFKTAHYHAGLTNEARKQIQDEFFDDKRQIIVATNAFGMGIDKSNIRTVVHYSITASLENYYQEIGRAGRDGIDSNIFLIYSKKDIFTQKFLIENSYPNNEEIKKIYSLLHDFAGTAIYSQNSNRIKIDKQLFAFFETQNIYQNKLEKSLEILETAQYLQILSPNQNSALVKFLIFPQDLKKYIQKIAQKDVAEVLTTITRLYLSKPFSEETSINLFQIAKICQIGILKTKEILRKLDTIGILSFEENSNFKQIQFLRERINPESLNFDTNEIEKNLSFQQQKLVEMTEYAESNQCRMRFITNYFGDYSSQNCGKCDNCLKLKNQKIFVDEVIANKILEVLAENPTFSEPRLISFLQNDGKVKNTNPNSGSLYFYSKDEISFVIRHLLKQNLIVEKEGILKILAKEENLSGKILRSEILAKNILRDKILELRKETAKKFNQPEKMIITDEIVELIIENKPKSNIDLLSIPGFNQRTLSKIGNDLLGLLKNMKELNEN